MEVPCYQEISVKNLYEDAMNMKDIIAGAHKARYTVGEDDTKKQAINIS